MIKQAVQYLYIGLILTIGMACQRTITDRYTEDELVSIMMDAHTLGLIYNRQEDKTDSLKLQYYEVIEQRYGISQEEFQKVVDGIILNAELYDRVYNRMIKKAEQLEQKSMRGI